MKARIAVALSVLAILVATTFHVGTTLPDGWSWYLVSGTSALAELIQNLSLFIPLGISLALVGVSPVRAALLGAILSFSVEFAQQWIPGRDPSLGDIVCNTISSGLGAGLVRLAPRWIFATPQRSAWQALGTALLALLIWFGTAAMLHATFPPPPYSVFAAPQSNLWFDYRGRYPAEIRAARLEGGILIVEAVAPSSPPERNSPLAAVLDANGTRAAILAVHGRDLSLRYHMPAVNLRLMQPDLRWRGALATIRPGDTFTAATGRDPGNVCMAVNTDWRCGLGYTIGDGWKLIFYPEGWPAWRLAVINALWVAGCVIGVGFWAARTAETTTVRDGKGRYGTVMAKTAVAVVILALIVVPAVTELKATSLWEWIGALGGIELGLVLGNRVLKDRLGQIARS